MIELTAADGHRFSAYRADPPETPKGALVVLQETSGVNAHIKKVAEGFAAKGYVTIVPALFDRVRKDVALAYDEASLADGAGIMERVSMQATLSDIRAAVDSVAAMGKVAVVGYCWGGSLAYQAGSRVNGLACAIGYYGGGIADEWRGKRKIPTLLHFGVNDEHIPFEQVQQFRANRPDVSIFDYPTGHGFNCDERSDFNADAAQLALQRTLSWISQYVEGQPPVVLKNAGAYAQAKTDKKKKKRPAADDPGPPAQ
jgi:carboxymethylenebutenolidase